MFNCRKCRIQLASRNEQQEHFQSQFHNYNTIRSLNDLPCIDKDEFNLLYEDYSRNKDLEEECGPIECNPCKKTFNSPGTYSTHLKSKGHRRSLERLEELSQRAKEYSLLNNDFNEELEDSSDDGFEVVPAFEEQSESADDEPIVQCLFCDEIPEDAEASLQHMQEAHCLVLPYIQFCNDLERYYEFIARKVLKEKTCLKCGKEYQSSMACSQHMLNKPHLVVEISDQLLPYFTFDDSALCVPLLSSLGSDGELSVHAVRLPASGRVLVPRQLHKYAKQNLPAQPSAMPSRLAIRENNRRFAITGGISGAVGNQSGGDFNQKRGGERSVRSGGSLAVAVKANKLQHHFREQL